MPHIDQDHTIGVNLGGTWVDTSAIASRLDVSVEDVEDALDGADLDWLSDALSDVMENKLVEEVRSTLSSDTGTSDSDTGSKRYAINFRLANIGTIEIDAASEDEARDVFVSTDSDTLFQSLTDDGVAELEFEITCIENVTAQVARTERNMKLVKELIGYIDYHGLDQDVKVYANGHRYSTEAGENRPAICTQYADKLVVFYDEGEFDVTEYLEYCNPDTITMSFEGPFYTEYNGYGDNGFKVTRDIDAILTKYDLYAEQGYAWSLSAYEENVPN